MHAFPLGGAPVALMLRRAPCWCADQRKTGNRLHFKLKSLTSIIRLPFLALVLHIVNLWEFLDPNILDSIRADGWTLWKSLIVAWRKIWVIPFCHVLGGIKRLAKNREDPRLRPTLSYLLFSLQAVLSVFMVDPCSSCASMCADTLLWELMSVLFRVFLIHFSFHLEVTCAPVVNPWLWSFRERLQGLSRWPGFLSVFLWF